MLKADEELIKWLLFDSGITRYRISKDTGIPSNTLSDLATGKSKLESIKFVTAAKITEYAEANKPNDEKEADH